jgi:hypothetical protein
VSTVLLQGSSARSLEACNDVEELWDNVCHSLLHVVFHTCWKSAIYQRMSEENVCVYMNFSVKE